MRFVNPGIVGTVWLFAALPAASHHSFAAVFDISRPIEITGAVVRLQWTNPHAWIYIDVEDGDGSAQTWSVELLGINTLLKQGWTPEILKPGDIIHVTGFGARDGSTSGNASSVTMAETGEQLWASVTREE